MFRGTCSSIEMLKEYMARETLVTPAFGELRYCLRDPQGILQSSDGSETFL